MLPTGYSVFLVLAALFSVGVALGTSIYAARCRKYCDLAYRAMQENTVEALSSSKIAELERSLTELWDSHASLLASHKRLRSKYGMADLRERRKAAENGTEEPGEVHFGMSDAEKAAYKIKLRADCKARGLLR